MRLFKLLKEYTDYCKAWNHLLNTNNHIVNYKLTLSTARGLGMSLGTPACDGKSLQLVGMVTGAPPK